MKLGIIFGGKSLEHEVSVVSASSIIKNLNREKYTVYPIYISKTNEWYEVLDDVKLQKTYNLGEIPKNIKLIDNVIKYLKNMDLIFPIIHGTYGEDGTLQGFLEMFDIPYVGCGILASSICMDKIYTKKILKSAGISVTPDIYIKYDQDEMFYVSDNYNFTKTTLSELDQLIKKGFGYPVFIKPANSGSSIGINKSQNIQELKSALEEALKIDNKILIEKALNVREIECAVLDDLVATPGEIKSAKDYYSFEAKYQSKTSKTIIPAELNKELMNKIITTAQKAFKVVDAKGMARIDFFLEHETNNIYLNEINTLPGFTEISMYPKMFENMKISFSQLLDLIIKGNELHKKC